MAPRWLWTVCLPCAFAFDSGSLDGRLSQEPCAQISNLFSQGEILVPADTALACLKLVPLDNVNNLQQLEGLKTLVGSQSDLSYLIKPPPGYLYPPVDILGGLNQIEDQFNNNFYKNKYNFQLDIYKVIAAAHIGHFSYMPDILGVFFFLRSLSKDLSESSPFYQLISISTDGVSLPDIYSAFDAAALASPNSSDYKPSSVSRINGGDVETWLNTYASANGGGRQQDPDAQYNALFPSMSGNSVPSLDGVVGNLFSQSVLYQGVETVLTFANGTEAYIITMAGVSSTLRDKFSRVTDGTSFFRTFCSGNFSQQLSSAASSSGVPAASSSAAFASFSGFPKRDAITQRAPAASSSIFGLPSSAPLGSILSSTGAARSGSAAAVPSSQVPYKAVPTGGVKGYSPKFPRPIVASYDYSVAGYFPSGQDDLAVLAIPSYEPAS